MSILCLSKRWKHHTTSGGYDRLVVEVGAEEVRRQLMPKVLSKLLQIIRTALGLNPPHMLDYRYEELCAERELLAKARQMKPDVVHVLYGDEQLNWLLRTDEPLACPLAVSFHLPTFRAKARFDATDREALSRIDAVIVLAKFQLEEYLAWFSADQLFYIPHGIDTNRFCPPPQRPELPGIKLATVGTHMRDFDVIERVVQHFEGRELPIQFDVVDSYGHCLFLAKYKKVRLHSKISEDALVNLYRDADALLLPVISATANNSALESLACGTPVISTDIEGMPDYVDPSSGWLFPKGDAQAIINLIEEAAIDSKVFSGLRDGARQKALEFSWERVAQSMRETYRSVVAKGKAASVNSASRSKLVL